jgi:hypothetical protein
LNPGVTFKEITIHLVGTVPERINELLESLQGDTVRVDADRYYPATETDEEEK